MNKSQLLQECLPALNFCRGGFVGVEETIGKVKAALEPVPREHLLYVAQDIVAAMSCGDVNGAVRILDELVNCDCENCDEGFPRLDAQEAEDEAALGHLKVKL
jgi:hypothetical protein